MKIFILIIGVSFISLQSHCQRNLIDSLQNELKKETTDTGRAHILYQISAGYQIVKPDSALLLAHEAYVFSSKIKYLKGQSWSLDIMAGAYNGMGNYVQALNYYLQQLKIEEQKGDPYNIAYIYTNIALLYSSEKDMQKALSYAFEADSIIKKNNLSALSLYSLLNIGDLLEKDNKIASALSYTKQCYAEAVKSNNMLVVGTALNNLGNIYSKTGDTEMALSSYRQGAIILDSLEDNTTLSECELGMAKIFERNGQNDSAIFYAHQSYMLSLNNNISDHTLNASNFLSELYKRKNNIDSAFAYQNIMVNLKDSIESSYKIKLMQSMTIDEQLRQKEMAQNIEQENEDRKRKLQLLAIAILIPIFFLLSIYISRKKVHRRIVEFSGIISILLVFEYIMLLIHPYVAEKTNHSPILEIIIFVAIAAIITPSHHKIQGWIMSKLTEIHARHQQKNIIPLVENTAESNEPV